MQLRKPDMQPFKLSLKDPEFGIVVVCKHFKFISRAYYLSTEESTQDNVVWCCCKTGKKVKDKRLSAFVMMHLLARIREYYPDKNFC